MEYLFILHEYKEYVQLFYMDSPIIKAIMRDKTLNMQERILAFMMFAKPESLPDNTRNAAYNFHDTGVTIKNMISDGKLTFHGFSSNGKLNYSLNDI
uniref:Uncharacterized protein n=1 Tax=viral metagenome TaxID=1070528 RepID=A0A6C0FBK6_9ZZZZ|tara:strand:- start:13351 stop:13641 length:291 start_codon:yes stop_codon:yes gene_type:complete